MAGWWDYNSRKVAKLGDRAQAIPADLRTPSPLGLLLLLLLLLL
jgi:hypothetical protein